MSEQGSKSIAPAAISVLNVLALSNSYSPADIARNSASAKVFLVAIRKAAIDLEELYPELKSRPTKFNYA